MDTQNEIMKQPPQAIDIEKTVIGACMLEVGVIDKVIDLISSDCFYDPNNKIIFNAILKLRKQNKPIDIMTVTEQLKQNNKLKQVGGAYEVTMLTSRIASTANVEAHAAIVKEKYMLRELIKINSNIQTKAYQNEDCFELITEMQEVLSNLTGFDRGNIKHVSDLFSDILSNIDRNILNDGNLTGIPTGFNEFDKHSSGLQKGDLVIIAGETSNGKTSIALNIAINAAACKKRIAIYSYEMSDQQLTARLLAQNSKVSSKDILYNKLNNDQINSVNNEMGELAEQYIFIDELVRSDYSYLERSIRSMVIRENIDLIIIDYLQLIKLTGRNMQKMDQIAQIANDLKNLAKILNIPIILISQLSRDRQNPLPTLARLKGSGDIENAADIVWFVWQPILYNRYDFECRNQTFNSEGNSHHIIAKGRNIGTTEFALGFNKQLTKFTNELNK